MDQDDIFPDYTESIKLGFEVAKQLTTLNAGSIVVIGTFLSNIFPTDKQGTLTVSLYIKLLIGAAFVGFGASLVASVIVMYLSRVLLVRYIARRSSQPHSGTSSPWGDMRYWGPSAMWWPFAALPLTLFSGGLICFGAAVLFNLFSDS
jgi:hypothetical protein